MTGYGAGAAEARGARVTVEIRGLNQRFLDVKVAVPREYAAWETEIRDRVRKTAQRGRVEDGSGRRCSGRSARRSVPSTASAAARAPTSSATCAGAPPRCAR